MKRVLVTGAGGFIGRHLLEAALAAGHEVYALSRRPMAFDCGPNCKLIVADLASDPIDLPAGLDAVIHAAAALRRPNTPIERYLRDNALATARLGRAAADRKAARFVYLSSVSVHGRIAGGRLGSETPIADPEPYGMTKYLGERALAQLSEVLPTTALRLPSVLGAGAHECWLAMLVDAAMNRRPLVARNPSARFNNAVDVTDVAAFILHLVGAPLSGFSAFPLGSAGTLSIEEIVACVATRLAPDAPVTWQEPGAQPFLIDNTDAGRHGWTPREMGKVLDGYLSLFAPAETSGAHGCD